MNNEVVRTSLITIYVGAITLSVLTKIIFSIKE